MARVGSILTMFPPAVQTTLLRSEPETRFELCLIRGRDAITARDKRQAVGQTEGIEERNLDSWNDQQRRRWHDLMRGSGQRESPSGSVAASSDVQMRR